MIAAILTAGLIAQAAIQNIDADNNVVSGPTPAHIRHDETIAAMKNGKLAFYPIRAQLASMAGEVLLDCQVDREGYFEDCNVTQEAPTGYGFAAKALIIVQTFHVASKNGAPIVPYRKVQPVHFKLNADAN